MGKAKRLRKEAMARRRARDDAWIEAMLRQFAQKVPPGETRGLQTSSLPKRSV